MWQDGCVGIARHCQGNVVSGDVISLAETHEVGKNIGNRCDPGGAEAAGGYFGEFQVRGREQTW